MDYNAEDASQRAKILSQLLPKINQPKFWESRGKGNGFKTEVDGYSVVLFTSWNPSSSGRIRDSEIYELRVFEGLNQLVNYQDNLANSGPVIKLYQKLERYFKKTESAEASARLQEKKDERSQSLRRLEEALARKFN